MNKLALYKLAFGYTGDPYMDNMLTQGGAGAPYYKQEQQRRNINQGTTYDVDSKVGRDQARQNAVTAGTVKSPQAAQQSATDQNRVNQMAGALPKSTPIYKPAPTKPNTLTQQLPPNLLGFLMLPALFGLNKKVDKLVQSPQFKANNYYDLPQ